MNHIHSIEDNPDYRLFCKHLREIGWDVRLEKNCVVFKVTQKQKHLWIFIESILRSFNMEKTIKEWKRYAERKYNKDFEITISMF